MKRKHSKQRIVRYKQVYTNEDGFSDWIYPKHKGYKLGCCDCGLVHLVDFHVKSEDDGEIMIGFRVKRGLKETAAKRRAAKFKNNPGRVNVI